MRLAQWSVQQAAFQFGVQPVTLKKKLLDAGVEIGRGIYHDPETVHKALSSVNNSVARMAAAKLKSSEENARLTELDRMERERTLVSLDEAKTLVQQVLNAVIQKSKGLPARLAGQCNPGDPALAREALDEGIRDIFETAKDVCSKL